MNARKHDSCTVFSDKGHLLFCGELVSSVCNHYEIMIHEPGFGRSRTLVVVECMLRLT